MIALLTSLMIFLSMRGANISADSLSVGNDMAALYPSYIRIRRGQVMCALLGSYTFCP